MKSQDTLLSMLGDESIIATLTIPPEMSLERILDARDSDQFSQQWMAAFRLIEVYKRKACDIEFASSTQIREGAYLHAYSRWQSTDLAACISDDFGLIADAATLDAHEPWFEEMLRKYLNGQIPGTPTS